MNFTLEKHWTKRGIHNSSSSRLEACSVLFTKDALKNVINRSTRWTKRHLVIWCVPLLCTLESFLIWVEPFVIGIILLAFKVLSFMILSICDCNTNTPQKKLEKLMEIVYNGQDITPFLESLYSKFWNDSLYRRTILFLPFGLSHNIRLQIWV